MTLKVCRLWHLVMLVNISSMGFELLLVIVLFYVLIIKVLLFYRELEEFLGYKDGVVLLFFLELLFFSLIS